MALTDKLVAIADAIRGKTGKVEEMTLDQMAVEIEGIEAGGGISHEFEDALITKTLTEYQNPRLTRIYAQMFNNWNSDTLKLSFPNVVTLDQYAFFNGHKCVEIDLGQYLSFKTFDFYDCRKLAVLILRSTTLCNLTAVQAFDKSPFASNGTGGIVYVPEALIESYKTATNWSTLYAAGTCNFVAIEGSEYE